MYRIILHQKKERKKCTAVIYIDEWTFIDAPYYYFRYAHPNMNLTSECNNGCTRI